MGSDGLAGVLFLNRAGMVKSTVSGSVLLLGRVGLGLCRNCGGFLKMNHLSDYRVAERADGRHRAIAW